MVWYYNQLAGSFIAGLLTECGPHTTGCNFCGFRSISNPNNVGYPIAEVESDGSWVITMHEGSNGAVTVDMVKAQLAYEIQGHVYLNPDAVGLLEGVVAFEEAALLHRPQSLRFLGLVDIEPRLRPI